MRAALWLVLAVSLVRVKALNTIPSNISSGCYLENSSQQFQCTHFSEVNKSEVEGKLSSEQSIVNLTTAETVDNNVFINASTEYPSDFQDNFRIYLVVHKGSDIWRVWSAGNQTKVSGHFKEWHLRFYNIPLPHNTSDPDPVKVRRIHYGGYLPAYASNKDETTECSSLMDSIVHIKHIAKSKTVVLTMEGNVTSKLTVVLAYGLCNINCSLGEPSECFVNTTNYQWENISNELRMNGLSTPSYYCARIHLKENDRCLVCTKTGHLTSDEYLEDVITVTERTPRLYYVITLLVLTMCCISGLLLKFPEGLKTICWHYSFVGNQNIEEIHEPDIEISEGKNETGLYDNSDILLLYYSESEEFVRVIESFRNLLKTYSIQVWDPLSDDQVEDARTNPSQWLEEKLKGNRIILVETENVVQMYRESYKNSGRHNFPHNSLYIFYALRLLEHSNIIFDYKSIHVIRFDHAMEKEYLQVVPCTRYIIPRLFNQLLSDLSIITSEPDKYLLEETMTELRKSIDNYQSQKTKKDCSSLI